MHAISLFIDLKNRTRPTSRIPKSLTSWMTSREMRMRETTAILEPKENWSSSTCPFFFLRLLIFFICNNFRCQRNHKVKYDQNSFFNKLFSFFFYFGGNSGVTDLAHAKPGKRKFRWRRTLRLDFTLQQRPILTGKRLNFFFLKI